MDSVLGTFGDAILPAALMMGAVLGIFLISMVFWVKSACKNKVYCYILSKSKHLRYKLVTPVSNTIVMEEPTGKKEGAKYLMHPNKLFWSYWPAGFPKIIQEPVPTLFYVEGNAEPLDPFDRTALVSPEALFKMSDEAMLRQTWKDVRESVGLRDKPKMDTLLLILVGIAALGGAASAYFGYRMMGELSILMNMFGG